jgi:hypothetical protein
MFRNGLLATSAMVVVGTLSFLAAQSAAGARPITPGTERDRNNEFLCTYGAFPVSTYLNSDEFAAAGWRHVAVPITGHGRSVNTITVRGERNGPDKFFIGLYTNQSSSPGTLLSSGTGRANNYCDKVTISVAPVQLDRGRTYWVEEWVPWPKRWGLSRVVGWVKDPTAERKAYEQYFYSNSSSHYLSPWTELSAGAYVKVR